VIVVTALTGPDMTLEEEQQKQTTERTQKKKMMLAEN
jgi:hypothetical protein